MHRSFLILGTALGGIAVVLGAFGAHKLKQMAPDVVPTFQTGVQYQMYHALALILLGFFFNQLSTKWASWAGSSFFVGVLLFSGSLYLISILKAVGKTGLGPVGIITPIGGLFFIAGWLFFLLSVLKVKSTI